MGMFAQIQNSVNSILPKLYEDEDLTTDITWRKFSGSAWDDAQGMAIETYVEYPVTAIKLEKENKSATSGVRSSGVSMSASDVVYLFRHGDLPDGITTRDVIIDNGNSYSVEKIYPVFDLVTKVEVQGYA